jgi:hypothetical protein
MTQYTFHLIEYAFLFFILIEEFQVKKRIYVNEISGLAFLIDKKGITYQLILYMFL